MVMQIRHSWYIHILLYHPSIDPSINLWMTGTVIVEQRIPDYTQDANGNRLTLPVMTITSDRKYHAGVAWAPSVIERGEYRIHKRFL